MRDSVVKSHIRFPVSSQEHLHFHFLIASILCLPLLSWNKIYS